MKRILFSSIFVLGLFFLYTTIVKAAVFYGSGVYTNLCGTGLNATANTCLRGCNTNNGSCTESGNKVVKFTCDGRLGECRSNESSFSSTQSVSGTACGKTVQIDVFTKQCRVNGNWTCSDNDPVDYMVWYSGDCQAQPTATPTQKPSSTPQPSSTPNPTATPVPTHSASCDNLQLVSGNDAFIPAVVTLRANATDNQGSVQKYRFYFGDGNSTESDGPEIKHTYQVSGTFTARAEIKDSKGNWRSSSACETQVKTKTIPVIESQKSGCSNVFIDRGNQTQAPTTAGFSISGYDNKGSIQAYKIEYGDGTTEEKNDNHFEKRYEKAGTYEIKGYIKDSQGNWKGAEGSCKTNLYVNTQPMKEQPKTGTPTIMSILGLASGGMSLLLLKVRKAVL